MDKECFPFHGAFLLFPFIYLSLSQVIPSAGPPFKMRHTSFYLGLIASFLGVTIGAAFVPPRPEPKRVNNPSARERLVPRDGGPTVLRPVLLDNFAAAAGLKVRDAVDFSRLDPAQQARMIFGAPGADGNVVLADMTLYAPDGQLIVMMELFEGFTSSVDCQGDDGQMSLTFKSKEAFDYAHSKWSFVNDRNDSAFLLIANHDGCGPPEERQPYKYVSPIP